jgi:hypothetical protein
MSFQRLVLLSAVAVLFFSGSVSAQSQSDLLDKSAWSDRPDYVENMDVSVSYEPVIEERSTRQVCTEYVNRTLENGTTVTECDSIGTEVYGGQNTYIFDVTDLGKEYLGNGKVRLSFTVERNELTKELFQSQKNPVQQSKFIDYFNSNYLFRDSMISSSSYDTFLDYTESVDVTSLGESLRAKSLESKNLMSVSNSRITTVVSLSDFRSGGVKLNDAVTVEVESSIA